MKQANRSTMRRRISTRDAVETAIDLSKKDKSSTWESLAKGNRNVRWAERTFPLLPDAANVQEPPKRE